MSMAPAALLWQCLFVTTRAPRLGFVIDCSSPVIVSGRRHDAWACRVGAADGPVSSLQNVSAAQYTIKIESFSLLRAMKKEKHVSDASGAACRFDHMKNEAGYDRLLALETFTTSSRFLDDDDSCVLGVELHVAMDTRKGACLSVIKGPKDNTHTWLVPNFSRMDDDKENWSPEYKIGDYPWWLFLYVKGYGKSKGKSISLYLYLGKGAAIPEGRKLYAEYKLRMKNNSGDGNKHWVKEDQHSFSPETYGEGFEDFVALDKLDKQGLIKDDCLEIEVEITFMAIIRDLD
ncbi:hypothetical protein RJ640_002628 [Escallonia rubra]|uniref:MATH domain-containing protein n=1 Tax=Escallonia rubra TaxID=112253 RepID=A0AA88UGV2_9ASTE|nr:hypothetical protein RJ640_002628 [Escallonia rubra]